MNNDNPQLLPCDDPVTGNYRYAPDQVVGEISAQECANLQGFTGIDGTKRQNCDDLSALLCDLKQEVDAINVNDAITIAANNESKCSDDDLPTLASILSRVLRYAQAATCMLCAYDPRISTILRTGRYPQILAGPVQEGGYPQWITPDSTAIEGSNRPITSSGVYEAVESAILAVWHIWKEQPEFDYFAQTLDNESDPQNLVSQMAKYPAESGNTALVAKEGEQTSLLYTYNGTEWELTRELTDEADNLTNFAVTHILKGAYATNGVYYFDGSWQVMDADIGALQKQVDELEVIFNQAVTAEGDEKYLLVTRPTLAEAESAPCDPNRTSIILVTG